MAHPGREIVGALLNGGFLAAMALLVLFMGAMRLGNPIDLPTTPMLIAAAGGIVTELISLRLLYAGQKDDLNIKGAYWHILQTFVGSLLIIVSAIVIRTTGFLAIDPLLGMAFGLVLLYASWGIMSEAVKILMESTPAEIDLARVLERLKGLADVTDVHHVHAWTLTSNKHVFSAHLRAASETAAPKVLSAAHALLRAEFGFHLSTLQIETECLDEDHAKDLDFLQTQAHADHHG